MQQRLLVAFWAKFRCHKWANHLAIRRGSGQVHSSCQQNEARFRLAGAGAVVVSQSSQF